jgi:hypothetical protein
MRTDLLRPAGETNQVIAMRFRFTIHDLLWLTALVAMGLAWWVDHRRMAYEIEGMNKTLENSVWEQPNDPKAPTHSPYVPNLH